METIKPRYALIYTRVSSGRQVSDGHGLESQEIRCRQWAEQNGHVIDKVFRDEGVSGGLADRPAMKALINHLDLHPQKSFIVIFDDLSRFARHVPTHLFLKSEILGRNALLHCLNFTFDPTPTGEYVELVLAGAAELHRKTNRIGVIQKMRARMDKGYWPFCPPTGLYYEKTKEHGKLLKYKPEQAAVLKEAIESYAEGRLLTEKDVLEFLEVHKEIFKKRKIHFEFVRRVLTEILYTGFIQYPKWEFPRMRGHHEGFIDIETYDKVQERLFSKHPKSRPTDKTEFPLRRLITCSVCNKIITGSRVKGKTRYHELYTCNNKACTAKPKNIKKIVIEEAFTKLLASIAPDKPMLEFAKQVSNDLFSNFYGHYEEAKSKMNKEIDQLRQHQSSLADSASTASNTVLKTTYENKIIEIENKINELQGKIAKIKIVDKNMLTDQVLDFIGTPQKYWNKTDTQGKIIIHRLIFKQNPTFSLAEGFGTPQLTLPFHKLKELNVKNNTLVEMLGVEPRSTKV